MSKTLVLKILLSSILFVLVLGSCGDESKQLERSRFGYEYFPVDIGQFKVYKVEETIIQSNGNNNESRTFYIREEITESFVNTVGNTIHKVVRSFSDDPSGDFFPSDVWTVELSDNSVIRIEENLEFVKMIFPFTLGSTWEGNLFDNLTTVNVAENSVWVYKDWGDYEVGAIGIPFTVEGELYPAVTRIDQADTATAIERRYAKEYYALGIGLIQKELEIFDTQCVCDGQEWIEKAQAGFTWKQTLIDHN